MDKFTVSGIAGFDGDYPIDIGSFTMRELHIIKDVAGVRAGELEEAFGAGDTDVILAVAVIAVRRNGGDFKAFQALAWESEMGSLTFVADEEEAGDPPVPTPLPNSSSVEATPEGSGDASSQSSGGDDLPETSLRAIGGQS